MQGLKIGDQVTVSLRYPERYAPELRKWSQGRDGILMDIYPDDLSIIPRNIYRVEFKECWNASKNLGFYEIDVHRRGQVFTA